LHFLAAGGIEHHKISPGRRLARSHSQTRNQHELAIRRELQPVRSLHRNRRTLNYFLGGKVDDAHRTVLRVARPYLLAVRRDIESLGAAAHRNVRHFPRFLRAAPRGWSALWCTWRRRCTRRRPESHVWLRNQFDNADRR